MLGCPCSSKWPYTYIYGRCWLNSVGFRKRDRENGEKEREGRKRGRV